MMSETKFTTIVTEDGTRITVQKPRLIDLLPSPKDIARAEDEYGPSDAQVNGDFIRSKTR
jgi:hypothetical protein